MKKDHGKKVAGRYAVKPEQILRRSYTKSEKGHAAYQIITGEVSRSQLAIELRVDLATIRKWVRDVKAETKMKKITAWREPAWLLSPLFTQFGSRNLLNLWQN